MLLEVFHAVLLWSVLTSLLVLLKAGICLKLMIFYLKFYRKKIGNRKEHLSGGTICKELMF